MPDMQSTEPERKPRHGKWFIVAGLMAALTVLLIRPMIHCPSKSAAQVVNPVPSPHVTSLPWVTVPAQIPASPQVTALPPADTDESENTVSSQVVESEEAARLQALDAELAELDTYVAEERQRIETWYASALAQLKAWAENRCKKLDGEEKAPWAWCLRQIQNTEAHTEGRMMTKSYSQGSGRFSPNGYVVGSGYSRTEGRITQVRRSQTAGDPAADYRRFLIGIENSRAAVERELNRLREVRDRQFAQLEAFANPKKAAIATRRLNLNRETARRIQGGPGLLDGIFASGSGYGAMIDGEVVHEGSSINGYRVRSITRDNVQCEKDGQVFTLSMP